MKDTKKIIFVMILVGILTSMVTAYATTYLYNANEVSYDNTNSNISSTNVQNAITELYDAAQDYSSINSRVSALEGYWPSSYNGRYLSMTHSSSSQRGFIIKESSGNTRSMFYYSPSDDETVLRADSSSAAYSGDGTLNLKGNPVKVNGQNVLTTASTFASSNLITDCNSATTSGVIYYVKDNGANCPSTGWVYVMPIGMGSGTQANLYQIAMLINSSTPKLWVRSSNMNSGWGAWKIVTLTSE